MQVGQTVSGSERIDQAIRTGSAASGLSFDYMARTAYRESSYQPDLKATTSTATGLYQFLDQVWLEMLKEEGSSVGLGQVSNAITKDSSGRYSVTDPTQRQKILDLRNDPTLSAVMAGRMTERNVDYLNKSLGRTPTQGEAYIAHVLGPAGGTKLIRMKEADASQPAATAFPREAAANQPIFYAKDGRQKTAGEVYDFLARQHGSAPMQVGSAGPAPYGGTTAPQASSTRVAASAPVAPATTALGFAAQQMATDPAKTVRTTIGMTSIPGEQTSVVPPAASQMSGWRVKEATSAFAALLRSDGTDNQVGPLDLLGQGGVATGTSSALPSSMLAGAYAPLSARMVGAAERADAMAAGAGSTASAAGVRPSRILLEAAAQGAPGMPLPMVTDALGVARPSRFSAAGILAAQQPSSPAVASAIRSVPTTAVTAQTYVPSSPPAVATTPAVAAATPVATEAKTSSATQPLDLLRYRRPLR